MSSTLQSGRRMDWTTRNVVIATLCVAGVGTLFYLLFRLPATAFLTALALVLGTAIRPAVNKLQARGVLRPVGIFVVYMMLALAVFGFMVLVVPLVADQGMALARNVPEYYETLRGAMLETRGRIITNLALRLPASPALLQTEEPTAEQTLNQVEQTYAVFFLVLKVFLGAVSVLLVGFYWALEGDRVIQKLLRFVPPPQRGGVRKFFQQAEWKLGGFIRGQGILSVTVGAAALIAYSLIGLPYAFVLAVIAGIFELVPFFGPVLGAIPALLVSLSSDPTKAVWVVIATAVIQFVENTWLVPRIMNHSMGVNPIVTLLSLVTFSSALGFAGAVLSLPFSAVIQLILDRLAASAAQTGETASDPLPTSGDELNAITGDLERLMRELNQESVPE